MELKRDKSHEGDHERISPVLLKSRTGEFDLESILFLKLRNQGIHDLGCIGECVNIEKLDLSGNNITNLSSLASLRLLSVLNLCANRVSNLDSEHRKCNNNKHIETLVHRGQQTTNVHKCLRSSLFFDCIDWNDAGNPLRNCESLQNINLSGNVLNSFECLYALQSLRKLENIRLKDNTYNYSNPVCRNAAYRTHVLEMFPNLKVLDGERVVGRGSDLYQLCKDIDDTIKAGSYKNGQLVEQSDCKPWVEDNFWEIKRSNNAIVDEAYKQFNDVLHECRLLNNRATHVISQTERSMSLKKQTKQYAL